MSDLAKRLFSWAQNEEMVDVRYTQHGQDCINAGKEIERLSEDLALEKLHGKVCITEIERLRVIIERGIEIAGIVPEGAWHDWVSAARAGLRHAAN
jgi:hypothetical protein